MFAIFGDQGSAREAFVRPSANFVPLIKDHLLVRWRRRDEVFALPIQPERWLEGVWSCRGRFSTAIERQA